MQMNIICGVRILLFQCHHPISSLNLWLAAITLTCFAFAPHVQAAAETAYDMVSPGPTFIEAKKIKRFPRHRLAHQPVDLREGVAKAYSVVKEVSAEAIVGNQS